MGRPKRRMGRVCFPTVPDRNFPFFAVRWRTPIIARAMSRLVLDVYMSARICSHQMCFRMEIKVDIGRIIKWFPISKAVKD
jgi:hypothetical protein